MTDTKNDFSKGNVVENILKLAVPMTLALCAPLKGDGGMKWKRRKSWVIPLFSW